MTIDVGKSPATATYTGDLYGLGHASRYVRPGAVRIGSTGTGHDGVQSVAFQNVDGTIALLVMNTGQSTSRTTIPWHGKRATVTLPPSAVATYTWAARPSAQRAAQ